MPKNIEDAVSELQAVALRNCVLIPERVAREIAERLLSVEPKECTCGASAEGKWRDIHSRECPAVASK